VVPPLPGGVLRDSVCVSPPLNVTYLGAVLRSGGHKVAIVDSPASRLDELKAAEKVKSFGPDLVGISSLSQTYNSSLKVAHAIREILPDVPISTGGPHATFFDRQTAQHPDVDIVVRGEGEATIVDLANQLEAGHGLDAVLGITYKEGARVISNGDRPFIQDLDSLPFPAYDLIPLSLYGALRGRKIFLLLSSRGCPYGCGFCIMYKMDGNRVRARSPKNVADEIELLISLGADSFSFCDETFTFNAKGVEGICDEILARRLEIPWDCQTRSDLLKPSLLEKMRKSGCELICLGVESGSQRILDRMKKRTTVAMNLEGVRAIKKAGIAVSTSLIIGYPGEDAESLEETIRFVKTTSPDIAYLNIATPFPGTEFYDEVSSSGLIQEFEWQKYDITMPVFETTTMKKETLLRARRSFYNSWYSLGYVLRNLTKENFYNRTMGWFALNYIKWRFTNSLKKGVFRSFR